MKKVILFYASYGGGHLSAAKSIKQYIDENIPDTQTYLIDCMAYIDKTLNKITTLAYKEMAKKAPWAWGKVYYHSQKGALAKISSTSNKFMARKLLKLFHEIQPDTVISTHPFGSQMTSYLKEKQKVHCSLATVMTDFAPHDQWLVGKDYVDFFFVSHTGMKEALMQKGIEKTKIFATGIPLSNKFLQHYKREDILSSFGLTPDKRVLLFFGGGEFGLGKTRTLEILKSFLAYTYDLQIVAISGRNQKMKKHFEELVEEEQKQADIKILEYTDKVPELMSISELVVTKPGGLTVTESLASGLPIIIMNPIPGQEEENAEFLEKKGVAIWLHKQDNAKQIVEDLIHSPEKIKQMKINARLLAKKNATKEICEIIFS